MPILQSMSRLTQPRNAQHGVTFVRNATLEASAVPMSFPIGRDPEAPAVRSSEIRDRHELIIHPIPRRILTPES